MDIVKNIYKSRKTVLEMLRDRGYDTKSYENFTPNEINIMIYQHKNMTSGTNKHNSKQGPLDIKIKRPDGRTIFVKYKMDKFRITKSFETFITDIFTNEIDKHDTLILLVGEHIKISGTIEKFIQDSYNDKGRFIQVYSVFHLLFNISRHTLVSPHIIISEREKEEVMRKYNITSVKQFPTISREDAAAKYYGIRPGDICRIVVTSGVSGEYIKYRHCTP